MTTASKAFCLSSVVAINALLVPSLAYTWLTFYWRYSYPIDFLLPIERTDLRATVSLCVAAITVPFAFVVYARTERHLSLFARIATLAISGAAAFVAIAFGCWRYLR